MGPTKRDQLVEAMEAIENSMGDLSVCRDMWENNLIFWLCKGVLLLMEKEIKK